MEERPRKDTVIRPHRKTVYEVTIIIVEYAISQDSLMAPLYSRNIIRAVRLLLNSINRCLEADTRFGQGVGARQTFAILRN